MENKTSYVVCALKNSGPLFAFLIGEVVSADDSGYTVRNVIRALEHPDEQGNIKMNFMTSGFFTTDVPSKIEGTSYTLSRILDPVEDQRTITQIENFLAGLRMSRAGLVGGTIADQGSRGISR